MIPKYRVWDKELQTMLDVSLIDFKKGVLVGEHWEFGETNFMSFNEIVLMQSTELFDRNDNEIFEGDVLKFNDEWAEYCHEGYVDGSVEGINFVEVVRGEACFEFGKTRYPESSLFIRMEDERLTFAELIKSRDFEFEIIGNVYENPGLLEVE
nr:MAG TPA: YopX protein [Caudoviricetes sp.]